MIDTADIAQENQQLAQALMEHWKRLRNEPLWRKEAFIFFLQERNPVWKGAMSILLQEYAVVLFQKKLLHHLGWQDQHRYPALLDHILHRFLEGELQAAGIAGLLNKSALLKSMTEFDQTAISS